jgi:glycogen operon protein
VCLLNARRQLRSVDHEHRRINITTMLREATKAWHGVRLDRPDWSDHSHSIALGAEVRNAGLCFHLILNAYSQSLDFELPERSAGAPWLRWIDTSLDAPDDITDWREAPPVAGKTYRVQPHSVVMLVTASTAVTRAAVSGGFLESTRTSAPDLVAVSR